MRSKLNVLVAATALVFAAHTAAAQNGGGMKASTTTAATTSLVTVTIPGVVGIDIESDVVFDLGNYVAAATGHASTVTACPANTFPPPAGCTGAATYDATASNTTASVPLLLGALPLKGNIWMAVFCTKTTGGPLTLQASTDAAFSSNPGFTPTALRNMKSALNNTPGAGNATATNFATTATPIGIGSLGATFGWTRVDQLIDLAIPAASGITYVAGSYTANATFTINK